jgi:hypothetical protein
MRLLSEILFFNLGVLDPKDCKTGRLGESNGRWIG